MLCRVVKMWAILDILEVISIVEHKVHALILPLKDTSPAHGRGPHTATMVEFLLMGHFLVTSLHWFRNALVMGAILLPNRHHTMVHIAQQVDLLLTAYITRKCNTIEIYCLFKNIMSEETLTFYLGLVTLFYSIAYPIYFISYLFVLFTLLVWSNKSNSFIFLP